MLCSVQPKCYDHINLIISIIMISAECRIYNNNNNNCLKSNIQCIEIRVQWTVQWSNSSGVIAAVSIGKRGGGCRIHHLQ